MTGAGRLALADHQAQPVQIEKAHLGNLKELPHAKGVPVKGNGPIQLAHGQSDLADGGKSERCFGGVGGLHKPSGLEAILPQNRSKPLWRSGACY